MRCCELQLVSKMWASLDSWFINHSESKHLWFMILSWNIWERFSWLNWGSHSQGETPSPLRQSHELRCGSTCLPGWRGRWVQQLGWDVGVSSSSWGYPLRSGSFRMMVAGVALFQETTKCVLRCCNEAFRQRFPGLIRTSWDIFGRFWENHQLL